MIVEIDYWYYGEVTGRGKPTPVTRTLVGSMPVAIQEVAEAEAPIALSWTSDFGKENVQRFFEGKIFGRNGLAQQGIASDPMKFAAWVKENPDYLISRGMASATPANGETGLVVHSSNEGDVQASLLSKAKDVIIIDGDVWIAANEPIYIVGFDPEDTTSVRIATSASPKKSQPLWLSHRADQYEQALAHARSLGELNRAPEPIQVFMQEVLSYNPEAMALTQASMQLVESMKSLLETRSLEWLLTYGRMRDKCKTDEIDQDLAELVRIGLGLIQGDQRIPDWVSELVSNSLARWDAAAEPSLDDESLATFTL